MRLYTYISNENGTLKQQGGNERLDIELMVEKVKGQWKENSDKINVFLLWKDGNPTLHIETPEGWKPQKTNSKKVFQFIRG